MKDILNITATGVNLHHLIAFFETEGYNATNLTRKSQKELSFCLPKKEYKRLKKEQIFALYKFKVQSARGITQVARTIFARSGLFIGCILVLLTTINITNRVQVISFNSAGHTCQNGDHCIFRGENFERLQEVLKLNGVEVHSRKDSLPKSRDLERVLMREFKQISGASLQVVGVKANVVINESKLPASFLTDDIVAPMNGIVVSIETISGKAKVKLGDVVCAGQTLVEAQNVQARANITLRTFFHEATIYSENQLTYTRTNKKITKHELSVFGMNFSKGATCNYSLYETEVSIKYVFYNFFLPLKTKSTTFYELEATEVFVDFESAKPQVEKELEEKTRALLPHNAEYKATTFATFREGARVRVDCYVEAYLKI